MGSLLTIDRRERSFRRACRRPDEQCQRRQHAAEHRGRERRHSPAGVVFGHLRLLLDQKGPGITGPVLSEGRCAAPRVSFLDPERSPDLRLRVGEEAVRSRPEPHRPGDPVPPTLTPVFLSTPGPFRWKFCFVDRSETTTVSVPAVSVFTCALSSLSEILSRADVTLQDHAARDRARHELRHVREPADDLVLLRELRQLEQLLAVEDGAPDRKPDVANRRREQRADLGRVTLGVDQRLRSSPAGSSSPARGFPSPTGRGRRTPRSAGTA